MSSKVQQAAEVEEMITSGKPEEPAARVRGGLRGVTPPEEEEGGNHTDSASGAPEAAQDVAMAEDDLTSSAKIRVGEYTKAYEDSLSDLTRAIALGQGLEHAHPIHVDQASATLEPQATPTKGYFIALGSFLAGACLSNLLEMIGLEQKIAPGLGIGLVGGLVVGMALITIDILRWAGRRGRT